nr:hypothetical protein [Angustibacter aerolatus]
MVRSVGRRGARGAGVLLCALVLGGVAAPARADDAASARRQASRAADAVADLTAQPARGRRALRPAGRPHRRQRR